MPNAYDRFIAQAHTNLTQRSVHIDTGANDGRSTRQIFKRLCLGQLSDKRRPLMASGLAPHLLVLVEAQAKFVPRLRQLAVNCTAESRGVCEMHVVDAAAWTSDGLVAFSSNRDSRAAYAGSQYQKGQRGVTQVRSIDFGAYLRRTLHWSDNAMMKLVSAPAHPASHRIHIEAPRHMLLLERSPPATLASPLAPRLVGTPHRLSRRISSEASSTSCRGGSTQAPSAILTTFSSSGTFPSSARTILPCGWRRWECASPSLTCSSEGARRVQMASLALFSTTSCSSQGTTLYPDCGSEVSARG